MKPRRVILEYKVDEDNAAVLDQTTPHGPIEDAGNFLLDMGAVKDGCGFVATEGDRPGDWEFGETNGNEVGPYVLYPKGWDKDGDNDELKIRIFAIQSLKPIKDLQ